MGSTISGRSRGRTIRTRRRRRRRRTSTKTLENCRTGHSVQQILYSLLFSERCTAEEKNCSFFLFFFPDGIDDGIDDGNDIDGKSKFDPSVCECVCVQKRWRDYYSVNLLSLVTQKECKRRPRRRRRRRRRSLCIYNNRISQFNAFVLYYKSRSSHRCLLRLQHCPPHTNACLNKN